MSARRSLLFHAKGMWVAIEQIKSLGSRCRQASVHDAPENVQDRHGSAEDTAVHVGDRDPS